MFEFEFRHRLERIFGPRKHEVLARNGKADSETFWAEERDGLNSLEYTSAGGKKWWDGGLKNNWGDKIEYVPPNGGGVPTQNTLFVVAVAVAAFSLGLEERWRGSWWQKR